MFKEQFILICIHNLIVLQMKNNLTSSTVLTLKGYHEGQQKLLHLLTASLMLSEVRRGESTYL